MTNTSQKIYLIFLDKDSKEKVLVDNSDKDNLLNFILNDKDTGTFNLKIKEYLKKEYSLDIDVKNLMFVRSVASSTDFKTVYIYKEPLVVTNDRLSFKKISQVTSKSKVNSKFYIETFLSLFADLTFISIFK